MNTAIPGVDGLEWLMRFMLAAVRPLAMVVLLPNIAGADLPWRGRLALVAALAVFAAFRPGAPVLSGADVPGEMLAGLVAGLALAFGAAGLAGEMLAQMVGLGFAQLAQANTGVLSALFTTLAWVALLAGDVHLELLALLATMTVPVLELADIAAFGGLMFLWGLKVALPILAVLLLANAVVAITNRAAPQLSAMAVGPAALLLAFVTLLPLLFGHLFGRLAQALESALGLLG
ncbi:flagellar biosynthetic protein FliR [Sandarakinorhabdus sp.]|uniref:flagellar biosynthetic protein FliR n=1 Tax=Sandarakinorhabdus sp. TaxID=1916663 RepID=UPI0028AAAF56|nr:flagellar biosynthetic protein FliR [Sandarakinorhabdus sp.]